jgi:hypothetical protein
LRMPYEKAKRLHDLPITHKRSLKFNAHNNGDMAMGHNAVYTSNMNKNDKPDLNEAFFIKRKHDPGNLRLLPACAVVLDLISKYFSQYFIGSHFNLPLSYYTPLQDVSRLQVRTKSCQWLDKPVILRSFSI